MKKIFFYVAALLLLTSCDDEPTYSCDKQTDNWVKENIELVRSINRDSFLTYSGSKKRAMYRAFTPEQRISLWKEKLNEVKMLSWNDREFSHIAKLEEFIDMHTEYFMSGLSDDRRDVVDSFFYQWQTYAIDSLGWSKQICFAIAGSPNRMNKNGEIEGDDLNVQKNTRSGKKGDDKDCNCNLKLLSDFCGITGSAECTEKPCDESSWGCGWGWLEDCNGVCL